MSMLVLIAVGLGLGLLLGIVMIISFPQGFGNQ